MLKKGKKLRNNCLKFSVKWPMILHIKHKLKITLWKEISKETIQNVEKENYGT